MKVSELIAKLQTMEQDKEILVCVGVYTQRFSVVEVSPYCVDHLGIHISLGEGYSIQYRGPRDPHTKLPMPNRKG